MGETVCRDVSCRMISTNNSMVEASMNRLATFTSLIVAMHLSTAGAQTSAFDGHWKLRLECPATTASEGAKGYGYDLDTEISGGNLKAVRGVEGAPGWEFLHGTIDAEGVAHLTMDGIVNLGEYAIGRSPKGKAFSYPVDARFEGNGGVGQRLTGRTCRFLFQRL
jgi:hypothetical protein